jgi:uncharacterized protein with beta-barrel porin domain
MLVSGENQHPAVLAAVHIGGTIPLWFDSGAMVGADGDFGIAIAAVRQADVDGLTLSGNLSLTQGSQSANGRGSALVRSMMGTPARMGGMSSAPVTIAMPAIV